MSGLVRAGPAFDLADHRPDASRSPSAPQQLALDGLRIGDAATHEIARRRDDVFGLERGDCEPSHAPHGEGNWLVISFLGLSIPIDAGQTASTPRTRNPRDARAKTKYSVYG